MPTTPLPLLPELPLPLQLPTPTPNTNTAVWAVSRLSPGREGGRDALDPLVAVFGGRHAEGVGLAGGVVEHEVKEAAVVLQTTILATMVTAVAAVILLRSSRKWRLLEAPPVDEHLADGRRLRQL